MLSAAVGIVTIGGARPSVLVEGEARNAQLVAAGGALRLPKAGDEVLFIRSDDGENLVVGDIAGAEGLGLKDGEVCITAGNGGVIRILSSGQIEIEGNVVIRGRAEIQGALLVNGLTVP